MSAQSRRDALVERLRRASFDALDVHGVFLGSRLGLYSALATHGPLTAAELATSADVPEPHAREWLAQQAEAGILEAHGRRYTLPEGHDEALLGDASRGYAVPFLRFAVAVGRPLP
jgi:hypothetical protein